MSHLKLKIKLKKKKLLDNITYLGTLNKTEVINFFYKIDYLFFHSNHKGEGKPGVLVESLIQNKPIITNYKINCENWESFYRENNIIFTNGSINDYSNKLDKFIDKKISFSNDGIKVFSSEYCFNNIKKIINGFN